MQDVVYNHYDPEAERAQSQYDSTAPGQNLYYWYEGRPSDYPSPDGGYLDNGSTGRTPRLWEDVVRQQFISSAAFLIEDMHVDGLRVDLTQALFRFYQDLITLTRRFRSIRSQNIEILHQSNSNRVIAFKRWTGDEQVIIVASLNDTAFADGYIIEHDLVAIPHAGWKEIFNSDSARFGGQNVGNGGAIVGSASGRLNVVIPAAGLLVFVRQ